MDELRLPAAVVVAGRCLVYQPQWSRRPAREAVMAAQFCAFSAEMCAFGAKMCAFGAKMCAFNAKMCAFGAKCAPSVQKVRLRCKKCAFDAKWTAAVHALLLCQVLGMPMTS